jgi:hypothetical protein
LATLIFAKNKPSLVLVEESTVGCTLQQTKENHPAVELEI